MKIVINQAVADNRFFERDDYDYFQIVYVRTTLICACRRSAREARRRRIVRRQNRRATFTNNNYRQVLSRRTMSESEGSRVSTRGCRTNTPASV